MGIWKWGVVYLIFLSRLMWTIHICPVTKPILKHGRPRIIGSDIVLARPSRVRHLPSKFHRLTLSSYYNSGILLTPATGNSLSHFFISIIWCFFLYLMSITYLLLSFLSLLSILKLLNMIITKLTALEANIKLGILFLYHPARRLLDANSCIKLNIN